jgi:hypothetical protein
MSSFITTVHGTLATGLAQGFAKPVAEALHPIDKQSFRLQTA